MNYTRRGTPTLPARPPVRGCIAERAGVALELSPLILDIFLEAQKRYGPREWSPNVIRRLEERSGLDITAPGFPAELLDDEPEQLGCEVDVARPRAAGRW